MKLKKFFIYGSLLAIIIVSGLLFFKRYIEHNREIEKRLTEYISPLVGGEFIVQKVRVGLFSLRIEGVKVSIPFHSFTLGINEIKVSLSLQKLINTHGNLIESIDKITFIEPDITIQISSEMFSDDGGSSSEFNLREYPLSEVLIENGVVLVLDSLDNEISIITNIDGNLQSDFSTMSYSFRGALGGNGKNVFIKGAFTSEQKRHDVSLHIEKTEIEKPLTWGDLTLGSGVIEGKVKLSLYEENYVDKHHISGAVELSEASIQSEKYSRAVENITLGCSFDDQGITIDNLTIQSMGGFLNGQGYYRWAELDSTLQPKSSFKLLVKDLSLDSLGIKKKQLPIEGTLQGEVTALWKHGDSSVALSYNIHGVSLAKKKLSLSPSTIKINLDSSIVTIDTVSVVYDSYRGRGVGVINYSSGIPFIDGAFNTDPINSDRIHPKLTGAVELEGVISGYIDNPTVEAVIRGKNVSYDRVHLGNPSLDAVFRNKLIRFSTDSVYGERYFSIGGSFFDMNGDKIPQLYASGSVNKKLILSLLKGDVQNVCSSFERLSVDYSINGNLNSLDLHTLFDIKGMGVEGVCSLDVRFNKDKRIDWRIKNNTVTWNKRFIPFTSYGTFTKESLVLDTLILGQWLSASGNIDIGDKISCDITISGENSDLPTAITLLTGDSIIDSGAISIKSRLHGYVDNLQSTGKITLRDITYGTINGVETDIVFKSRDTVWTVLPFVVRKDKQVLFELDTLSNDKGAVSLKGEFKRLDVGNLLKNIIPSYKEFSGELWGTFENSTEFFPLTISLWADSLKYKHYQLEDIKSTVMIDEKAISIKKLEAFERNGVVLKAESTIPFGYLQDKGDEKDTVVVRSTIHGDILKCAIVNGRLPLKKFGNEEGRAVVNFRIIGDDLEIDDAHLLIPPTTVELGNVFPEPIQKLYLRVHVDKRSRTHIECSGLVRKKKFRLFSTHELPDGYEHLQVGPLDFGAIYFQTPDNGLPTHIGGYMEENTFGDIEFTGLGPFQHFTVTGPVDKLKLTGTMVLRNTEFTYPTLPDPADTIKSQEPSFAELIDWQMDIKPGNRKVGYFYSVGGKKRRLFRFIECFIDPSVSNFSIRGVPVSDNFKLYGTINSYRGSVFYGREFERNFQAGAEFMPLLDKKSGAIDNTPIVWGSAEAFADGSRYDRVKLTLLTRDSLSSGLRERGRINDFVFSVSSTNDGALTSEERKMFQEAGESMMEVQGTGEYLSAMGEQYFQKYFLQNIERRIAKSLGLDVLSLETSIASNYFNYFYNNREAEDGMALDQFANNWQYYSFANIGITVGRYFLRDQIFLKWRTEFIQDSPSLVALNASKLELKPHHYFGFEYQPVDYFWMDFSYGFYKRGDLFINDPRIDLQLRFPINKFKDFFKF